MNIYDPKYRRLSFVMQILLTANNVPKRALISILRSGWDGVIPEDYPAVIRQHVLEGSSLQAIFQTILNFIENHHLQPGEPIPGLTCEVISRSVREKGFTLSPVTIGRKIRQLGLRTTHRAKGRFIVYSPELFDLLCFWFM